jgi:hypothetical protein
MVVLLMLGAYYHHRLLVFRHPDAPEAGIQVPAGTVEANERLKMLF